MKVHYSGPIRKMLFSLWTSLVSSILVMLFSLFYAIAHAMVQENGWAAYYLILIGFNYMIFYAAYNKLSDIRLAVQALREHVASEIAKEVTAEEEKD